MVSNMSLKAMLLALAAASLGMAQDTTTSSLGGPGGSNSFPNKCAALRKTLKVPNTTVWTSTYYPSGSNITFPDTDPSCATPFQIVNTALCRVTMKVATSSKSEISLEAWLPSDWTGRFLSTGNGGLGGCIQYGDMAYTVEQGFATVGANNGHNGTSGLPFLNHPGVIEDFAYRSVHTGAVVGKQVTAAFYGRKHTKSYWMSCSTGGRQGFKSAQDFPDDFDGIVAGAPAFAFNNLSSWSGSFYAKTGPPTDPRWISPDLWLGLIGPDILAQCDGIDGVRDGIIEDSDLCQYKPDGLVCQGNATANCLTPAQVNTVKEIFSPLYGEKGWLVYPRMQPGSEFQGAPFIYYNGAPFIFTTEWFRYVVYSDPNWDPTTIGPKDYTAAQKLNPYGIDTWKGDLSAVRQCGAKILHYHGNQDPIISSDNSARYYNHVRSTMGLSPSQLDQFYRYFRISGMGHCAGGPGAVAIGNGGGAQNATLAPEGNVLSAVVRWVEQGVAPDTILGTAFVGGDKAQGVDFQRRHCRYPKRNVFQGGDYKKPSSWKCV